MKKILSILLTVFAGATLAAQAPTQIKYQGVARDAAGAPIANGTITVQFDIHATTPTGTIVYTETHSSVTTNQFGLFSINMGSIIPLSPTLFGSGLEFLEVSVDFGSGLTSMGTSQLLSVPYALYAETSGSSTPGPNGFHCWDLNMDNINDPGEDINSDSQWNVLDCQGAIGMVGATGAAGANGATGPSGIDGATGATGAAGSNGATGLTGATGAAGANGATGLTGATGAAGANGVTGATGAAGANGATGLTGATGAAGANGATGATGAAGANGATGPTGVAGANGATGAAGANGAAGATGATGTAGTAGANGATGPTGANGAAGTTGPTGANGATGAANISGTTNYVIKFTSATSGGNSLIFDNGTNVGINTATPAAQLHISNNNRPQLLIEQPSGPGGAALDLKGFNNNGSRTWRLSTDVQVPGDFSIRMSTTTGGSPTTDVMTMTPTGLVGIGTTLPSYRLDVHDPLSSSFMAVGTAQFNGQAQVRVYNPNVTWGMGTETSGTSRWTLKNINSGVEVITATTTGNVGIGTSTPVQKLEVNGIVKVDGIGVPFSAATPGISLYAGNDNWKIGFDMIGGRYFMRFANDVPDAIHGFIFSAGPFGGQTDLMTILGNGRVGIGTSTPTANLDVNGTTKLGTNGTVLTSVIKNSQSIDLPAIAPTGGVWVQTFAVPNAAVGSEVHVSPELALPDGIIMAYSRVSAANTVEVKFYNASFAPVDPPVMNWHITVVQ